MRQIVLDTETTGLEPKSGHRIIEIGCVELQNRRLTGNHFHCYLNPEREVDEGAVKVHGLSSEFLADKPLFADVADEFIAYIEGAELVIHNAPFDVGFIDHEFRLHSKKLKPVEKICSVLDTLSLARSKHPGQKNTLDALCKRYGVDNSKRELHGALLDAEILADVYLLMTGGQTGLFAGSDSGSSDNKSRDVGYKPLELDGWKPPVITPDDEELAAHQAFLDLLDKKSGDKTVFRR